MKTLIAAIVSMLIISVFSCSKSSDWEPDPVPETGNALKATFTFSTGKLFTLNSYGSKAVFMHAYDSLNFRQMVVLNGYDDAGNMLRLTLTDIWDEGTYMFNNDPFHFIQCYAFCEYVQRQPADTFNTFRMLLPGNLTLQKITADSVIGTFDAQLTNGYPGKTGAVTTIRLTNGSVKGKID